MATTSQQRPVGALTHPVNRAKPAAAAMPPAVAAIIEEEENRMLLAELAEMEQAKLLEAKTRIANRAAAKKPPAPAASAAPETPAELTGPEKHLYRTRLCVMVLSGLVVIILLYTSITLGMHGTAIKNLLNDVAFVQHDAARAVRFATNWLVLASEANEPLPSVMRRRRRSTASKHAIPLTGFSMENATTQREFAEITFWQDRDPSTVQPGELSMHVVLRPPHSAMTSAEPETDREHCVYNTGFVVARGSSALALEDSEDGNWTETHCPSYRVGVNTDDPSCHLEVYGESCFNGAVRAHTLELSGCGGIDLCDTVRQLIDRIEELEQRIVALETAPPPPSPSTPAPTHAPTTTPPPALPTPTMLT